MGSTKLSETTSNTTTQATPTAEEKAMEQLQLQQMQATNAPQTQAQLSGLSLVNQLLTGNVPSGELYQQIGGITEDQTQSMVNASLRDIMPQFQSSGIMDSGTAIQTASRTAADVRNQNAQFNIGAKQNLLNLALSGQAQVQAPVSQGTSQLASQLAGLRTVNQSGTTSTYGMNPFLQSFQTSLGQSLGNGSYGSAWKPIGK